MQACPWRPAGDRRADVEKVAVAVGPGAEDRVAESDGVAFTPGDVLAEARGVTGLIGRAGPSLLAAELDVGLHHPARHGGLRTGQFYPSGVQEIECADVEGRRHADPATALDQALDEVVPLLSW